MARIHRLSVSQTESPCLTFSCEPRECSAQTRGGNPVSLLSTPVIFSHFHMVSFEFTNR